VHYTSCEVNVFLSVLPCLYCLRTNVQNSSIFFVYANALYIFTQNTFTFKHKYENTTYLSFHPKKGKYINHQD
jgi:hypothetical protein